MNNAKSTLLKKGIQFVAAATLLMAGQTATAANVTVRVVDAQTLKPVSNAAVCLGTEAHPGAYGAMRTNKSGEVVYSKAPGQDFVLSVSGNGHGDYVRTKAARGYDIVYYIELRNSGLSSRSRCLTTTRQPAQQMGKEALSLVSVDVRSHNHNGGTVDVATQVTGVVPTHIRASTNADFKDARWLPYRQMTRHPIERVASENLYVQVKRRLAIDAGSIEAVSTARVGDLHWD